MKLLVLTLLMVFIMSSIGLANIIDDATNKVNEKINQAGEKAGEKINKAVDDSADKLTAKISTSLEKGFDWLVKKILAIVFFFVELFAIAGIGWILSYLCDRDSRKMVRILVVLCVVSLVVDKLKSLIA